MPTVTLQLPPEVDRRLRRQATDTGQTLESYLLGLAEAAAAPEVAGPPDDGPAALPRWDGVVLGSMSRRELYDDVR